MVLEGTRNLINNTIGYRSVMDCRRLTTKEEILGMTYRTMGEATLGIRDLTMNNDLTG